MFDVYNPVTEWAHATGANRIISQPSGLEESDLRGVGPQGVVHPPLLELTARIGINSR